MNKSIITGRLTKDPEIKDGGSTKVAKFTIASQRSFKDSSGNYGADFINCTAFGKTADFVSNYFHKGSQICVEGRINTGSYTNKDGQKVYTTDVAVEKVEFMGNKADNDSANGTHTQTKTATPQSEGFMNIPETVDDFTPFG